MKERSKRILILTSVVFCASVLCLTCILIFLLKPEKSSEKHEDTAPTTSQCHHDGKFYELWEDFTDSEGFNSCTCTTDGVVCAPIESSEEIEEEVDEIPDEIVDLSFTDFRWYENEYIKFKIPEGENWSPRFHKNQSGDQNDEYISIDFKNQTVVDVATLPPRGTGACEIDIEESIQVCWPDAGDVLNSKVISDDLIIDEIYYTKNGLDYRIAYAYASNLNYTIGYFNKKENKFSDASSIFHQLELSDELFLAKSIRNPDKPKEGDDLIEISIRVSTTGKEDVEQLNLIIKTFFQSVERKKW